MSLCRHFHKIAEYFQQLSDPTDVAASNGESLSLMVREKHFRIVTYV